LFEAIDQETKKRNIKINEHMEKLEKNLPIELMLDSLKHKYPGEIEDDRNMRQKSFADAIQKFGLNSWKIWKSQKHFDDSAMRFLQEKPDLLTLPLNEDINFDVNIGLLFASNEFCKLKFAEVPQLVQYTTHEYDGLEEILF
jgi:hypothetical protein